MHNCIWHLPVLLVKRLNMPNSSVKVPPPAVDVIWSNILSVSLSAMKFKTFYIHLRAKWESRQGWRADINYRKNEWKLKWDRCFKIPVLCSFSGSSIGYAWCSGRVSPPSLLSKIRKSKSLPRNSLPRPHLFFFLRISRTPPRVAVWGFLALGTPCS